jgi:hypothetical protein
MYGPLRLIYNNFITSYTMLTLSSQASGKLSGSSKDGTGVARQNLTGPFTGEFDLSFDLEIDSIAGGVSVGQATFKWRNSASGAGVWEETGILTRTTPEYALSADGLGTGITVGHTALTGADFALADAWKWYCRATYGAQRLLDLDRMTTWRTTADSAENIVIDLGSAQTPTLFILGDHNLTAAATVTLEGNASDSWGSPSFSYEFTSIADPLYYYIPTTETYRYWRITFVDSANPDTYIEAANLFLGTYLQLTQVNAVWGSRARDGYVLQANTSQSGVMRRYSYGEQQTLDLLFGNTLSNADITSLLTLQTAQIDDDTNLVLPLWVHFFSDTATTLKLMDWGNLGTFSHQYFQYLLNSGAIMRLVEVVKV